MRSIAPLNPRHSRRGRLAAVLTRAPGFARGAVLASLLTASIGASPFGTPEAAAEETSFQSQTLAPDATWQALSGATAALGEGLSGVRGNPAGLGALRGVRSAASHLIWPGDLAREWVAIGGPVASSVGAWADVSVLHGPALPGYDADGGSTGDFSPTEWAAGAAVSASVTGDLHLGLGARYFRLEDPSAPVSGVGVSAGGRFDWGSRSMGLSVSDLGTVDAGDRGTYGLPTTWRLGVRQVLESSATVYAGGYHREGSGLGGVLGVSVHATPWASLHGGAEWVEDASETPLGWSSGVSLTRDRMTLSYAFRSLEALPPAHQFGLEVPIGPSARIGRP